MRSASLADSMRVTTSAGPPGGNGTIQRIGFDGHAAAVCACARVPANAAIAATSSARCLAFILRRSPICTYFFDVRGRQVLSIIITTTESRVHMAHATTGQLTYGMGRTAGTAFTAEGGAVAGATGRMRERPR